MSARDYPAEIARLAAQAGIDNDVYCGGPIDLVEVTPAARAEREERRASVPRAATG